MPASHPRESDDRSTKVFVLEAVQQLVAQGLAVWRRCAADEFELELVSGAFRPLPYVLLLLCPYWKREL